MLVKKISRTEHVRNNALCELLYDVVAIIFPFAVRTVMIEYLGADYLGLNSLFTSILSVINVADLGLESALIYFLYEPIAKKDTREVCALLNFYNKIFKVIGAAILALGLAVIPFLHILISGEISSNVNVYSVFLLFLSSVVISYWTTMPYRRAVLLADQHSDSCYKIVLLNLFVVYSLQIWMIIRRQYISYVFIQLLGTALMAFQYRWVFRRKYPEYQCSGNVDRALKLKLKDKVLSVAVYRVRDVSRNSLDSMILSFFCGLEMLACYQNYYMVMMVPNLLRSLITDALTHSLGNYNAVESKENVYKIYQITLFTTMILSGWGAIAYFSLIQDFVCIWMGSGYVLPEYVAGGFALYLYVLGFCDVAKMMRTASGIWEQGRIWAFMEMVMNVVLNIVLAKFWGVLGIIIATVITIVFIHMPCEMRIMIRGYFGESYKYSLLLYAKNMVWFAVTFAIVYIVNSRVPQIHFWRLVLKSGVCVIIPAVMVWLFYGFSNEMKYIRTVLKRFLSKQ